MTKGTDHRVAELFEMPLRLLASHELHAGGK